ncbi:MAG: sulfite exporter TauE/SafE family protein [Nevskiaceae bacterium]
METLLIYAVTGVAAGLLAGLFGVGGGLIMVPALAFVLSWQGVGPAVVMHVAVATSLAVISATSVSSMLAHHRRQGVLWPVFLRFAPGLALGAIAGAFVAHALPGLVLQRIVGAGAVLVAIQMLLDRKPAQGHGLPGDAALLSAGGVIGLLSALIGIGGGSLTVPFLTWRGVPIRQAVGTSAACGVPIAWAGAAGFVVAGWAAAGRPEFSLGYVALPAFAAIAVASVATAPLGARLAHRLPPRALRRAFAVLLVVIGVLLLSGRA